MLWLWISIYIIIGAGFTIAYLGKYHDPRVRMALGMHSQMSHVELIFVFFFWPIVILIAIIGKIL